MIQVLAGALALSVIGSIGYQLQGIHFIATIILDESSGAK